MRLVLLQAPDLRLDLLGELVGVAHRTAGPVGQSLLSMLLIALENLVAGFARDAEFAAFRSSPRHPEDGL